MRTARRRRVTIFSPHAAAAPRRRTEHRADPPSAAHRARTRCCVLTVARRIGARLHGAKPIDSASSRSAALLFWRPRCWSRPGGRPAKTASRHGLDELRTPLHRARRVRELLADQVIGRSQKTSSTCSSGMPRSRSPCRRDRGGSHFLHLEVGTRRAPNDSWRRLDARPTAAVMNRSRVRRPGVSLDAPADSIRMTSDVDKIRRFCEPAETRSSSPSAAGLPDARARGGKWVRGYRHGHRIAGPTSIPVSSRLPNWSRLTRRHGRHGLGL